MLSKVVFHSNTLSIFGQLVALHTEMVKQK